MSRIDQHAVFGFWIYFPFYILLTGTLNMDRYSMFFILLFSIFPDLDSIYYALKSKLNFHLDETFQHHYKSITHYPLVYTPFVILLIPSLILNFYPTYFLAIVIGVYGGHFLFDSIACGDGIMWGKNPLKRLQYGRFINIYSEKTDGYHGKYWYARYRKTLISKFGNILVISTIVFFSLTGSYYGRNYNYTYSFTWYHLIGPIVFTTIFILIIRDVYSKKWKLEPPNGRYSDYRKDSRYINGLSKKNRRVHLKKYNFLLE
jgi:hypothetical protein